MRTMTTMTTLAPRSPLVLFLYILLPRPLPALLFLSPFPTHPKAFLLLRCRFRSCSGSTIAARHRLSPRSQPRVFSVLPSRHPDRPRYEAPYTATGKESRARVVRGACLREAVEEAGGGRGEEGERRRRGRSAQNYRPEACGVALPRILDFTRSALGF